MKKLLLLIVAAMFAATSFPACSDDDKDKGDSASQFVGTWELVHYFYEDIYGESEDYDVVQGDEEWHKLVVEADGTFTEVYDAYNKETGVYSIVGNTVTFLYDGDSEIETMTIKLSNASTLVLEDADSYGVEAWTYKRR